MNGYDYNKRIKGETMPVGYRSSLTGYKRHLLAKRKAYSQYHASRSKLYNWRSVLHQVLFIDTYFRSGNIINVKDKEI